MVKYFTLYLLFIWLLGIYGCREHADISKSRPNILWITSEDMNAFVGVYGDSLAQTPHLDKLASTGVIFKNAFATAPVCSPSRSCLVTGIYATSLGTQHLRSEIEIPDFIHGFPKYLREAGYYCSNNGKEDYNFQDSTIWDESSTEAHWRNRKKGQPFFSVFNFETTHQSRIFGSDSVFEARFGADLVGTARTDPSNIAVPPYHFDSPLVRKLWARYYDLVSIMDRQVGEILSQLKEDGLEENTIIFYYADHGTGMPRSKRALYDSGLRVPLIVKAPSYLQEKLGLLPGTQNHDLVSFVDFAPTMLRLVDLDVPDHMQGINFIGPDKATRSYVFGHADRVDEAYEISRTVRTSKYRYVRNYLPYLPLIQPNFYTDQSEIMQELYRLKEEIKMTLPQEAMWQDRRLPEELYDLENDPYEVNNLIGNPELNALVKELRGALKEWTHRTYDSGLLHESDMHFIAEGTTIYESIRDNERFPIAQILATSDLMMREKLPVDTMMNLLKSENSFLRYWAILVLHSVEWDGEPILSMLKASMHDKTPSVRLAACLALCKRGYCRDCLPVIWNELNQENRISRLLAARTLQEVIPYADPLLEKIENYAREHCPQEDWNYYYKLYTCWALEEGLKHFTSD